MNQVYLFDFSMIVKIPIDLENDFDGIELELAIDNAEKCGADQARLVLIKLFNNWVKEIDKNEWVKPI